MWVPKWLFIAGQNAQRNYNSLVFSTFTEFCLFTIEIYNTEVFVSTALKSWGAKEPYEAPESQILDPCYISCIRLIAVSSIHRVVWYISLLHTHSPTLVCRCYRFFVIIIVRRHCRKHYLIILTQTHTHIYACVYCNCNIYNCVCFVQSLWFWLCRFSV